LDAAKRQAQEIYGATLLLEKNGHPPRPREQNRVTLALGTSTTESTLENPIDDLIELVSAHKGHTIFLDKGTLEAHHGVAMILPY